MYEKGRESIDSEVRKPALYGEVELRVKCNSRSGILCLRCVVCFSGSRHFLWDSPVRMNYTDRRLYPQQDEREPFEVMIKWQAMLLRFIVLSANQNDHFI